MSDQIIFDVDGLIEAQIRQRDKDYAKVCCQNLLNYAYGKGLLCDNPCDNEGNLIMPSIIKESSLYGSNGKIEKMYSKGSRGSREETYFYENDRLQKIVIRQFDRNDIEQDTLQHSFDYKSNGELKSIILSTELYSETIYQETLI